MGDTKIEWTDKTWSPIVGCTRKSSGCEKCYSERFMARFSGIRGHKFEGISKFTPYGPRWTGEVRLHEADLTQPLRWRKPSRIFVNSISDTFHEKVKDEWLDRIFAVMALAGQHTFQVLTKRPERMKEYLLSRSKSADYWKKAVPTGWTLEYEGSILVSFPLPNVHIGVSVEDQATADERIPILLQTPATIRWISYEPALGGVDFYKHISGISQIVVGGESGPGARPFDIAWARSIIQQCREARVAVFYKQGGSSNPCRHIKQGGKKGSHFGCFPADLQVREFPTIKAPLVA